MLVCICVYTLFVHVYVHPCTYNHLFPYVKSYISVVYSYVAPANIYTPVAIYMQFSDLGHLLSDAVCPKLNINIHIHIDKNYSTTESYIETSVGNESLFVFS